MPTRIRLDRMLPLFTTQVRSNLLPGAKVERISRTQRVINGQVEIEQGIVANCTIKFGTDWYILPPKVYSSEPWVMSGIKWHRFGDSSFCYVFGKCWQAGVLDVAKHYGIGPMLPHVAAFWMCDSVRWLLSCHWTAHKFGLKEWPKEWPGWPHGRDDASKAFKEQFGDGHVLRIIRSADQN